MVAALLCRFFVWAFFSALTPCQLLQNLSLRPHKTLFSNPSKRFHTFDPCFFGLRFTILVSRHRGACFWNNGTVIRLRQTNVVVFLGLSPPMHVAKTGVVSHFVRLPTKVLPVFLERLGYSKVCFPRGRCLERGGSSLPERPFVSTWTSAIFFCVPSSKLTWQWKIPMFNGEYIFNRSIFHCHVSLPEGRFNNLTLPTTPVQVEDCFFSTHQVEKILRVLQLYFIHGLLWVKEKMNKWTNKGMKRRNERIKEWRNKGIRE